MSDQTVNGWSYRYGGATPYSIEGTDPQGRKHSFPNWNAFWRAAGAGAASGSSGANGAVIAFMILFGLHNILFFLCTMGSIGNLLLAGKTDGQLNLIPLLLAWICGSMMFGLAGILAGLLRRS